jgi:hypothetical protein
VHARAQIRERIREYTLQPLEHMTGSGEIYRSRDRAVTLYPSIAVIGDNEIRLEVENPGYINDDVKRYRRFYLFTIQVAVSEIQDADLKLDELCSLVETRMAADDNMGGGVIATDLTRVRFNRDGSGSEAIHVCEMEYQCEFRTTADDPETFLM